ncbi:796_t:CDS:2, partial [Paraglomus occultum]
GLRPDYKVAKMWEQNPEQKIHIHKPKFTNYETNVYDGRIKNINNSVPLEKGNPPSRMKLRERKNKVHYEENQDSDFSDPPEPKRVKRQSREEQELEKQSEDTKLMNGMEGEEEKSVDNIDEIDDIDNEGNDHDDNSNISLVAQTLHALEKHRTARTAIENIRNADVNEATASDEGNRKKITVVDISDEKDEVDRFFSEPSTSCASNIFSSEISDMYSNEQRLQLSPCILKSGKDLTDIWNKYLSKIDLHPWSVEHNCIVKTFQNDVLKSLCLEASW